MPLIQGNPSTIQQETCQVSASMNLEVSLQKLQRALPLEYNAFTVIG